MNPTKFRHMKKQIITLTFLLIAATGFSQISGGLFAGPNLSWFGVESKMQSNDGVRLGYTFGAMADFPITENFSFNLAVKYNDIGGTIKYGNGAMAYLPDIDSLTPVNAEENMKYNLSYLDLPIGFKGKTNEIGFMSYFMKAGVTPMIRLKGKVDVTADSNDLFTEQLGLFNMSWFMGAGFEWSLTGNTRFFTEVVYNGGIFDFIKKNDITNKNIMHMTDSNPNDEQFTKEDVTVAVFEDQTSGDFRNHVGKVNSVSLKIGILF